MKHYRNKQNKSKTVIISLVAIVLILIGFITWTFIANPAIDNYILEKQFEARDIVLQTMIMQIQEQGYVQIQDANSNTLTLIEYIPAPTG